VIELVDHTQLQTSRGGPTPFARVQTATQLIANHTELRQTAVLHDTVERGAAVQQLTTSVRKCWRTSTIDKTTEWDVRKAPLSGRFAFRVICTHQNVTKVTLKVSSSTDRPTVSGQSNTLIRHFRTTALDQFTAGRSTAPGGVLKTNATSGSDESEASLTLVLDSATVVSAVAGQRPLSVRNDQRKTTVNVWKVTGSKKSCEMIVSCCLLERDQILTVTRWRFGGPRCVHFARP
jgi:hypothetical protein